MPYESTDNYKNYVCKCNDDKSCKIKNKYESHMGTNLVQCKCENNIITKFINDWKFLYGLNDK